MKILLEFFRRILRVRKFKPHPLSAEIKISKQDLYDALSG